MEFNLWPKGWGQATFCKLDYGCMYSCNPSTQQAKNKLILQLCISFWNYNSFGYPKGANEVNRQHFQQAVLSCLLNATCSHNSALYYAGIGSYAACSIICPKLCWYSSPRPIGWDFWSTVVRMLKSVPNTLFLRHSSSHTPRPSPFVYLCRYQLHNKGSPL